MKNLTNIITLLRDKNFRITPQRIAIIKYLLKTDVHPNAEEIYQVIQKDFPMISMATVYKTLDFLKNMGILHKVGTSNGKNRFEANIEKHVNMICTKCGKIEDVYEQIVLSQLENEIIKKSNYHIVSRRIEFYGYCKNCKLKL
jgi:Fur family transcriptional regulator, peroxide stress response regulator